MRDIVGYGWKYPKINWPDDARVVVSLVLNYEEGSELCVGDGDREGERVGEFVYPYDGCPDARPGHRIDLRVRLARRHLAGARPVRRIRRQGNDLRLRPRASSAIRWSPVPSPRAATRSRATAIAGSITSACSLSHEREQIRLAVASIAATTGERPVGWYCRYAPSVNTRRLLVEEGGFLYDCNSYADEIPYWVKVGDRNHLIVPYQFDANDAKFFRGPGWSGAGEFWEYLRDSVDCLVKEGRTAPKMLSVGLHGRIIGRPGRSTALARFLEYCRKTPGVSFQRRADIARWWHRNYRP